MYICCMKKTRKNFSFDTQIVKKAEKKAKAKRRSLTAHLEDLMDQDNKKPE